MVAQLLMPMRSCKPKPWSMLLLAILPSLQTAAPPWVRLIVPFFIFQKKTPPKTILTTCSSFPRVYWQFPESICCCELWGTYYIQTLPGMNNYLFSPSVLSLFQQQILSLVNANICCGGFFFHNKINSMSRFLAWLLQINTSSDFILEISIVL